MSSSGRWGCSGASFTWRVDQRKEFRHPHSRLFSTASPLSLTGDPLGLPLIVSQEPSAVAFVYSAQLACVVVLGAETASVACVEDGVEIPGTRFTLPLGGDDCARALQWAVRRRGGEWMMKPCKPLQNPQVRDCLGAWSVFCVFSCDWRACRSDGSVTHINAAHGGAEAARSARGAAAAGVGLGAPGRDPAPTAPGGHDSRVPGAADQDRGAGVGRAVPAANPGGARCVSLGLPSSVTYAEAVRLCDSVIQSDVS